MCRYQGKLVNVIYFSTVAWHGEYYCSQVLNEGFKVQQL